MAMPRHQFFVVFSAPVVAMEGGVAGRLGSDPRGGSGA